MRSIKTLLVSKFLLMTVVITIFMYMINESLLINSIKENTKNTMIQKTQHLSYQVDLLFDNYNKTLQNLTSHQFFSAYISENTKINTAILKEYLTETKVLSSKPEFALIDFDKNISIDLTYKALNMQSLNIAIDNILSEKIDSSMIMINDKNVRKIVFLNAVKYQNRTELVLLTYLNLNYFKNLIDTNIGKDFSFNLLHKKYILEKDNTINIQNKTISDMYVSLSYKSTLYQTIIKSLRIKSISYSIVTLILASLVITLLIVPKITKEIGHIENLIKDLTKSDNKNVKANTYISEIVSLEKTINSLITDLEKEKEDSLSKAHKAGMAEIAISVLHNIGNVLTSLNLRISNSNHSSGLDKLSKMLISYKTKLSQTLEGTPENKKVISITDHFVTEIQNISSNIKSDFSFYKKQLSHISDIISTQQNIAGSQTQNKVRVNLKEVADDCIKLKMDELQKNNIKIEAELKDSYIHVDKFGLAQVILNFLVNSMDSIKERQGQEENHNGVIKLHTVEKNNKVELVVNDNGVGIAPKAKDNLFNFGFSTKERSSGFGLHNCANYVKANEGTLVIESPGEMQGAEVLMTFTHHPSPTT